LSKIIGVKGDLTFRELSSYGNLLRSGGERMPRVIMVTKNEIKLIDITVIDEDNWEYETRKIWKIIDSDFTWSESDVEQFEIEEVMT